MKGQNNFLTGSFSDLLLEQFKFEKIIGIHKPTENLENISCLLSQPKGFFCFKFHVPGLHSLHDSPVTNCLHLHFLASKSSIVPNKEAEKKENINVINRCYTVN